MGRVLCIWLSQLPLDRLARLGDPRTEGAFAVVAETGNAWRVTHVSPAAKAAGVDVGLSLADARAICPDLATERADVMREQTFLMALARWADCLSPKVAVDEPDGLLLDISGCAHLFGGEAAMGHHCRELLGALKIESRTGIADTKGAARALARCAGDAVAIAAPGETADALRSLPVAGLDLPPRVAGDLRRVGLDSIGQLYAIQPAELARRFGIDTARWLAAALGQTPEPITPLKPAAVYAARMTLPEPIGLQADLERVIERLAESVCERLRAAAKGARRFILAVHSVDAGDHQLRIGFARPCAAVKPILEQLSHPLGRLRMEYGADRLRLAAEDVEPIRPLQTVIGRDTGSSEELDCIVSTLGNRLGFDRIRRFAARESHLPEREFDTVEAANGGEEIWKRTPRNRPLRLFVPPERLRPLEAGRPPRRFTWRNGTFETKSAIGPERLAPEWWKAGDLRIRDYWRVQTCSGPRLWLMSHPGERPPDWFVAGRFP